MKIISIIPARGGSKGIPRKNIKKLGNKPLIVHTIEHSLLSKLVDDTIVSTDDKKIKEISKKSGARVIERPKELASDIVQTEPVLKHAINVLKEEGNLPDITVFLQCTSPIRKKDDIDKAVTLLIENNLDSVFSVMENYSFIWKKQNNEIVPINEEYYNKRPRRQDKVPEYIENGSIYVFKTNKFLSSNNRICGKKGVYIMPFEQSLEIDNFFDFWLCDKIYKKINFSQEKRK